MSHILSRLKHRVVELEDEAKRFKTLAIDRGRQISYLKKLMEPMRRELKALRGQNFLPPNIEDKT